MKSNQQYLSPNQKAFRRLLKNKPAIFGFIIIGLAILIAFFAYALAPDSTPDANDQIPEIALADPGFSIKMLRVIKPQKSEETSLFTHMISGSASNVKLVPVNKHSIEGDTMIVEVFRGIDIKGSTAKFALTQVLKPSFTNKRFPLGTDKYGRDMYSRLLLGTRISLLVGFIAVIISLTIGILLGITAGYFGGRIDDFIMLIINTVWSIPTLLLVFAIVLALGRGVGIIFLAVGLTMWVEVARIVRGQVLSLREIQFVEAAQSLGFKNWRIMRKHILPNILGPVMVIAAANFATAILIEAGLSYLGFGIQPPTPSWGNMLNENYGLAIGGKPLLALIPAVAIMLLVLAFNLIGNGLRDALDIKS